jgi:hypothetical protein
MTYAVTNQPKCVIPSVGGSSALWIYTDGDAHADVDAAGYFTDGASLGLKANDVMIVVDTATPGATLHHVLNATTISAAIFS